MNKARRYSEGKLRYELIPNSLLKELAKVYTIGAEKYTLYDEEGRLIEEGSDNWKKGLSWKSVLGSVKRHIAKFENGEDYDYDYPDNLLEKYGPTYHLANAVWGLAALIEYYRIHPELDDRPHSYLSTKKIGLDIDGVIADIHSSLAEWCGEDLQEPESWDCPKFHEMFSLVLNNEQFFLDIKPLVKPLDLPFEPHCYITSRSIPIEITQKWLDLNGFPKAPLYSVGYGMSKVDVAKQAGVQYFIDDHIKNFEELNNAGICTFLMDRKYNKRYDVGYKRIKDFNDFKNRFL